MAEVNTKALETYVKRRRQKDKNEVNTVALEAYVKARRPGASYLTPTTSNTGATKAYWVQQAADALDPGARSRDALRAANTALQETPGLVLGSLMNAGSMVRDQVLPAVLMPTVPSAVRDKILPPVAPARREGSVMLRGAQANIEKARQQMETPVFGPTLLDFTTEAVRMGGSGALSAATGVPFSLMAGVEAGGRAADEAARAGKDLDTQLLYGTASGLVSAGVEGLAGLGASKVLNSTAGAALRKAAPKVAAWLERAGGTVGGRMLLSGVGEGFEEIVQYPLDKMLEWVILDDQSPYDVKEQAYGALMGFALGGLMSAPGSVAGAADARAEYEASAMARSAAAEVANRLAEITYESLGLDAPEALDVSSASEQQIKTRMQETYKVIRAQAEVERQQTREALRAVGVNPDIGDLAEGLPAASAPLEQDGTTPAMDPKIASMLPGASNITSGLVPNERSAQLPSATASLLDKVGKRIGVRITIGAPTGEMGANGWYSNGNLVIASDAQNPLLVVLKHEVTHRLQEVAPEEYTRFRNYAVRQMALRGHGGDADRAVQDYRRRYAQKGYNLTVDGALDEMAADYTEHLMENPGEFERVVLDNRTVARKIYDAVRQVVASIRAAFTGSARDRTALELTGRSYAQLQEGLRLWESALRAAENVTRTAVDLREQGARAQMAQNIASMEPAAAAVMQESPQYSLWRSTRGDTVAVVDDDILADVPRAEWVEKVKNNIRNRFPDGIQIANSQIQVNQKTAREYLYSESTKTLRSKRPLVFADKLRATGNLDDILRATQTWKNEKPRHLRKDSFTSFARGDVLLRVGQNDYTADVIVGNTSGGNDVLYDIISMKPTQLTLKNEIRPNFKPSSRNGERQKTETYPIDSTIPQADSAVKGNLQVPSEPRGQASLKNQDSSGDMHDVLSRLAQDRAVSEEEIDSVPEIIEARKKVRPGSSADINTPEREALREQMAEEILSRGSAQRVTVDGKAKIVYTGPVRKDRRVDIVIGLPAAGKSSVIVDPLSEQHQSMVLDSDEVKFILPEFNNGIGSGYIHEESKEILGIIRDSAIERGDNIVTPIVGSSTNKVLGEIERYRNAGYSVYLHLNELPANKAIGRALQRFLDTGRFIDPDVLLKYGDKPTEVYERIREMEGVIDGYSRYSNDVKYGEPPILIEQSGPERVRNVPGAVSVSNDGGNAGGLRGRPAGAQAQNRGGSSQAQKASPGSVPLSTNTSGAAPLVDARQNEATGQMPGGLIAPLGVAAIPDLLAGMKTVNEQIGDLLNGLTPVSEQIDALLNGLTPVETTNENGYPMAHDALYTDSRVYDYDFMVSQPDMVVTRLPDMRAILDENGRVDRDEVRKSGLKNAGDAGEVREGEIFVRNNYTGRELKVTNKTIMHSAHGDLNMLLTNGRLGAVAGDLIKRSIPVNGLRNKKDGVAGAYAMAAYAIDGNGKEFVAIITVEQRTNLVSNIGLVDMAHSISGRIKRSPWFPQRNGGTATETGTPASKASSTISIADFLDIVNSTHQGILSNDVLRHYRAERDMESYWGRGVQFSLKDDGDVAAVPAAVDAAAGIPDLLAGMTPVNEQIGALLNGLTPVNMRGILSRLAQDRSVTEAELDRVAEIIEARKKVRPGSSADINTPEREALRDQKAAEILSRGSAQRVTVDGKTKIAYTGPVRKDHRVDIVIGLPAAGKSSVIVDPLSEQHQSMVLDSDEVKFILPEFNNGIGSGYIHEESKKILRNIRDAAIGRGDNIVTPIVGSNTNKVLDEIERYRNAGYSVYLHLNELPPNKALGRALQRFLDTGRFIDPDVLLKYGDKPTKVYECIREMEGVIDGYSRYSNDVKYGEPPILIEQSD